MGNIAASIITIGDELLIGQTIDTNSAWIARELNLLGIDVVRRVAVGDNRKSIISSLDEELSLASLVIITGGLGPTADDITKPLLNEYFGGKLVIDERVLDHIKDIFSRRNRPFLDRNMKQAEVPDTCTVLFNKMGTAPGMWFEKNGKVVISLPGVPFEMVAIMEDEALPRIAAAFSSDALLHYTIVTAGEGESFIAEKLQDLESALPGHISLAYLPGFGIVKLRLTGRGANAPALAREIEYHRDLIVARLSNIVVCLEDIPMEQVLGRWFTGHSATIGLAESCTGGNIGHHITQVPGATNYFRGSLVCYQNEVKEKLLGVSHHTIERFGAVSEEVVLEMVHGAMSVLQPDVAFAITGLLSAVDNATVPVGRVWMAVADKNRVKSKEYNFRYDRERNKEMATAFGMLMIWKFVTGK